MYFHAIIRWVNKLQDQAQDDVDFANTTRRQDTFRLTPLVDWLLEKLNPGMELDGSPPLELEGKDTNNINNRREKPLRLRCITQRSS